MITTTHSASFFRQAASGTLVVLAMLALPALASAEAKPFAAPAIPGVAALPGPVVDPGKPAAGQRTNDGKRDRTGVRLRQRGRG